jgi:hypothetical protein
MVIRCSSLRHGCRYLTPSYVHVRRSHHGFCRRTLRHYQAAHNITIRALSGPSLRSSSESFRGLVRGTDAAILRTSMGSSVSNVQWARDLLPASRHESIDIGCEGRCRKTYMFIYLALQYHSVYFSSPPAKADLKPRLELLVAARLGLEEKCIGFGSRSRSFSSRLAVSRAVATLVPLCTIIRSSFVPIRSRLPVKEVRWDRWTE